MQISTNIHYSLKNLNAKCVSIAFNEHLKNECFFNDGKESLNAGVNALRCPAIVRYGI